MFSVCSVFNDGAFAAITKKDVRADMLIDLHHGEPILFGAEKQFGVIANDGEVSIANVDEVGSDSILVTTARDHLDLALNLVRDRPFISSPKNSA